VLRKKSQGALYYSRLTLLVDGGRNYYECWANYLVKPGDDRRELLEQLIKEAQEKNDGKQTVVVNWVFEPLKMGV